MHLFKIVPNFLGPKKKEKRTPQFTEKKVTEGNVKLWAEINNLIQRLASTKQLLIFGCMIALSQGVPSVAGFRTKQKFWGCAPLYKACLRSQYLVQYPTFISSKTLNEAFYLFIQNLDLELIIKFFLGKNIFKIL